MQNKIIINHCYYTENIKFAIIIHFLRKQNYRVELGHFYLGNVNFFQNTNAGVHIKVNFFVELYCTSMSYQKLIYFEAVYEQNSLSKAICV